MPQQAVCCSVVFQQPAAEQPIHVFPEGDHAGRETAYPSVACIMAIIICLYRRKSVFACCISTVAACRSACSPESILQGMCQRCAAYMVEVHCLQPLQRQTDCITSLSSFLCAAPQPGQMALLWQVTRRPPGLAIAAGSLTTGKAQECCLFIRVCNYCLAKGSMSSKCSTVGSFLQVAVFCPPNAASEAQPAGPCTPGQHCSRLSILHQGQSAGGRPVHCECCL